MLKMNDNTVQSSESGYSDSEEELQDAFAKGLLKPGLNEVIEKPKQVFANKVGEMRQKVRDMKLNLQWIETLDLVNSPAPLAPEFVTQLEEQKEKRANQLKNNAKLPQVKPDEDPILNDFKREMLFHRQAQAAVMEGILKLKKLNIPTRRPDDYFAEMAKSDEHMQKVRENLLKKQAEVQRSERVKQLRAQRKMGKIVQTEARLQKASDKRQMLDQVKKFRKGMRSDLDFLNEKVTKRSDKNKNSKKSLEKRKQRNEKFGFGGKKRGSKQNTKESSADVSSYRRPKKTVNKRNKVNHRPGKNKRQKMKTKGKRK